MKRILIAVWILCGVLGVRRSAQKTTYHEVAECRKPRWRRHPPGRSRRQHRGRHRGLQEVHRTVRKQPPARCEGLRTRLGLAYEKLGDAQARAAYERVMREFADQKDVASQASQRLEALRVPRQGNTISPSGSCRKRPGHRRNQPGRALDGPDGMGRRRSDDSRHGNRRDPAAGEGHVRTE